ncbi:acyltransferase [Vreelandella sp. EE22]
MSKDDKKAGAKIYWIDLCRVIATLGVIAIHASATSFHQFSSIGAADWLSANAIGAVSRISVPLFFLISGFLIITPNRDAPSLKGLWRRVQRIGIPLVVWSTVLLSYIYYYDRSTIDIVSIFQKPAMYHLWFVYALFGVYLLLPILQTITEFLIQRRDYALYFLVLFMAVHCVPILLPNQLVNLTFPTGLLGYAGFFIIGGYYKDYLTRHAISRPQLLLALLVFVASTLFTFVYTWMLSVQHGRAIQTAYIYFSPNVFLASLSFMVLISQVTPPRRLFEKAVHFVSERTFIIYFIHVVALEKLSAGFSRYLGLPDLAHLPLTVIATFIVCFLVSIPISKLPKAKILFG